jgi:hypothetical protein
MSQQWIHEGMPPDCALVATRLTARDPPEQTDDHTWTGAAQWPLQYTSGSRHADREGIAGPATVARKCSRFIHYASWMASLLRCVPDYLLQKHNTHCMHASCMRTSAKQPSAACLPAGPTASISAERPSDCTEQHLTGQASISTCGASQHLDTQPQATRSVHYSQRMLQATGPSNGPTVDDTTPDTTSKMVRV